MMRAEAVIKFFLHKAVSTVCIGRQVSDLSLFTYEVYTLIFHRSGVRPELSAESAAGKMRTGFAVLCKLFSLLRRKK